jgi:hypothetical protein
MAIGKWNSKTGGITLSDIIRGLQYCVNSSLDIVEQHYISSLAKFFTSTTEKGPSDKDNEIWEVDRQTIKINDSARIDVPFVSMADHSSLMLDEMDIKMSLSLKNSDLKKSADIIGKIGKNITQQENTGTPVIERKVFEMDISNAKFGGNRTQMDLTFKFKSTAPPETVSRLLDKLNDTVIPYMTKGTTDTDKNEAGQSNIANK